ncbi:SDR family oxidoreductase [Flavilitoribacter nigricans]|uniref:Short-chain dehydrogenase n=1 Tax=Flavilitoribacter nigricans (strain ATCC 23147 / DSM 23189 / NBRC 102662 / NCIMB 1420 / SS-2) TaxID=1122177 RepID=A0A2D0N9N2_FLAN2|nr:SDR family oxidoreductase [Flavilitoribacter nigricans]PHN05231.1 short-chain dehydrogenase [Flavilitoribacter nigricans DSM 23189 = NBRC 102662]
MDISLIGKNALVCGSSKGIGRATAVALAQLGANITLVARSATIMTELVQELDHSQDQKHDFLQADFTDSKDLKKKITGLVSGRTIHILINNTGGPAGGPITEAKVAEFQQAFHNHLICNHILTQSVIKGMKAAGYGRIINIISTSVKQPIPGLGVSNTIRGAVANWAKTMAGELAPFGITVNNVLPGMTSTGRLQEIIDANAEKRDLDSETMSADMAREIPVGRFAEPSEIAAGVAFLASPAASYITGINLPIDGGRTRSL